MRMIREFRSQQLLRISVLGLISLTFVNMLYCSLYYEFGWGPKSFLDGPEDRFADLIKLSLSFHSVTEGADKTEQFKNWRPIYQRYYEHPDFHGVTGLSTGELTNLHFPPLSTVLFLFCGMFIMRIGNPSVALYLFFAIYLFEVCCVLWIGIPSAKRSRALTLSIVVLCLMSYPAFLNFSRANYVSAGLTTLPIVAFLIATFTREQSHVISLLALAVAVNIHPNAVIFLAALPLAFGVRRAIKPLLQFTGICLTILIASYVTAHRLDADYTLETFRRALAIYSKLYIEKGIGVGGGSSLYGLVFVLHRGLGSGANFSLEIRTYYVLAALLAATSCVGYFAASIENHERSNEMRLPFGRTSFNLETRSASASKVWPRPLAPFFLVSLYCILSPVFADYHLLVFLAPLILACLEETQQVGSRYHLIAVIAFASVFMLSPKHYGFLEILLNPVVLCGVLLWLSIALIADSRKALL